MESLSADELKRRLGIELEFDVDWRNERWCLNITAKLTWDGEPFAVHGPVSTELPLAME